MKYISLPSREPEELMKEADRLLAYKEWFKEQVQVGLDQANREDFVEEKEMDLRIQRMFRS